VNAIVTSGPAANHPATAELEESLAGTIVKRVSFRRPQLDVKRPWGSRCLLELRTFVAPLSRASNLGSQGSRLRVFSHAM